MKKVIAIALIAIFTLSQTAFARGHKGGHKAKAHEEVQYQQQA